MSRSRHAPATTPLCGACERPTRDATLCPGCAMRLDEAIASISDYHGLAWDLDLAVTRQTRRTSGPSSRPAESAIPFDDRASDAAAALTRVLGAWASRIADETRAGQLADETLAGVASWLRPRVGWLRYHPDGADAYDQITAAVEDARHAVDRPADRLYAGPCNGCGTHLYARDGAMFVTCPDAECGAAYEVAERRGWLLAALDDFLGNSQQLARMVTYLGMSIPDPTIRWWASKKRITAHGHDAGGHPLYRLGEVVDHYYEAEKARADRKAGRAS